MLACNSKEPENIEVISMEELMGDGAAKSFDSTHVTIDSITVESSNLTNLISDLINDYDTVSSNKNHAFDRYGFNTYKKVKFIGKQNASNGKTNRVKPKADFYIYNFSDSVKLNNAFYNWLDCFGDDCNEVKLNQNIENVKSTPSFTLVYDTTLISIEYLCENDWKSFQNCIIKQYGENYRYLINVECGGPLKWK
tara:strand:+ start:61 stop:645 length:585 start_codon:yes stop_codon:yes gene_type:complete